MAVSAGVMPPEAAQMPHITLGAMVGAQAGVRDLREQVIGEIRDASYTPRVSQTDEHSES
jgi:hypothetical protein